MFPLWDEKPHKAKTDWCTGFPDILFGYDLWKSCRLHDQAYRKGYVKGYGWINSRKEADKLLWTLTSRVSNGIIGLVIYIGTRLFGYYAWKKWRDNRETWRKCLPKMKKIRKLSKEVD
jgi:hypothetical protein